MINSGGRFFGKYRGRVTDNDDPLKVGRIKAKIPDVFGDEECGWALPCFPFAGPGVGCFMVPPVDAWAWIEFEYGSPDRPIWTGCFFPADPTAVAATVTRLLPLAGVENDKLAVKTAKWLITIESAKVVVASLEGPVARTRLEITSGEIKLTNEKVPNAPSPFSATLEMSGNKVNINGSALEVT